MLIANDDAVVHVAPLADPQQRLAALKVAGPLFRMWTTEEIERSAAETAANDANLTYAALSARNLGTRLTPIQVIERLISEEQIRRQSEWIARNLESQGVAVHRRDGVTMIGELTGRILDGLRYRNINLIPGVAQQKRAESKNVVKFWIDQHLKARYARYLVISSGRTCTLDEFPERYDKFGKTVGRVVAEAWDHRKIETPVAAFEVTFSRDDAGDLRINLHVNLVLIPHQKLGQDGWREWLEYVRNRFQVQQIQDSGRLKDVAEIIKYATKPADLMTMTPGELARFHYMIVGKQLVRYYGELQRFRKGLKVNKRKIARDDKSGRLVNVPKKTREQEVIDDVRQAQEAERRRPLDAEQQERRDRIREQMDSGGPDNQVVFVTLPQARRSLIKERFIGIRNWNPNTVSDEGRAGLVRIQSIRAESVNRLRHQSNEKGEKRFEDEQIEAATSRLDTGTLIHSLPFDLSSLPEKRRKKILDFLDLNPPEIDPDNLTVDQITQITHAAQRKITPLFDRYDRHEFGSIAEVPSWDPSERARAGQVEEIEKMHGKEHRDARRRAYAALPETVLGW